MPPSALRGSSPVGDSRSSAERGRERERHRERKLHRKTRSIGDSLAWIFRTNLPPRRGASMQTLKKRDWFGFGDVLGVMAKPNDTLQQLEEMRKALEKAQRELRMGTTSFSSSLQEQLFSLYSLPSFNTHILPRPSESSTLHRIFTGLPSFTILCGAPSTGKTTLLRQVLRDEKYYALYLDMGVIGGAGLEGLFNGLCDAVEWLAQSMLKDLKDGQDEESRAKVNEEFERVARAVKLGARHLSTRFEKPPSYPKSEKDKSANFTMGNSATEITTHDVTRLIQLLRTALLLSSHLPSRSTCTRSSSERQSGRQKVQSSGDAAEGEELTSSEETKVGLGHAHVYVKERAKGKEKSVQEEDCTDEKALGHSTVGNVSADTNEIAKQKAEDADDLVSEDDSEKWEIISGANKSWTRRIPVLVFDDAHKLPSYALPSSHSSSLSDVSSFQIVRFLFEALTVLSKQDRLCHIVLTANDGSYINWLRELGVLEGCKIVTVSDTSKTQVHAYLNSNVLPSIPPPLRSKLESEEIFEKLYEAFGGRLAHWNDFVSDWLNAGGNLPVERSNAFLQAYTQLNFLLMRTSEAEAETEAELEAEEETVEPRRARDRVHEHDRHDGHSRPRSRCCCCRTQLGTKFRSRSSLHLPMPHTHRRGMKSSTTLLGLAEDADVGSRVDLGGRSNIDERIPFTVMQLLDVFYRLTSPCLVSTSSQALASTLSPTIRPVSMRSIKVIPRVASETGRIDSTRKDYGIPYFAFCRELGACLGSAGAGMRAVNFLIREHIVELRWARPLPSRNPMSEPSRRGGVPTSSYHSDNIILEEDGEEEVELDALEGVGANGTIEIGRFGPTLHPLSPILAYAMRVVLDEYGYQPAEDPEEDADAELVDEGIGVRIGTGRRRGRNDEADNDDLFYRSDGHNERGGGGRESSGLSDGQSDYVSLEDVSEY